MCGQILGDVEESELIQRFDAIPLPDRSDGSEGDDEDCSNSNDSFTVIS